MGLERWLCNSICCSYRGPEFHFQHPLSGWQPPVTPVPPAGLHQHQACTHTKSKHSNSNLFLKCKLNIIGRGHSRYCQIYCPFQYIKKKKKHLLAKEKNLQLKLQVVSNFKTWKNSMLKVKNNNSLNREQNHVNNLSLLFSRCFHHF